jgi:hypothetical protein
MSGHMSEVFEGYELQYCEVPASLSRNCTTASALDGGAVAAAVLLGWDPRVR